MNLLLLDVTDWITQISNALFHVGNSVVGHSRVLDTLLALPMTNQFVKAALIGGCFLAVWLSPEDTLRKRRILLITLVASVLVIATTKTLSKTVFLPRPFIQSQKAFHLENNQLVETPRLAFRVPLDEANQKDYRNLRDGDILPNDLGSFPSDHAGFYVTLAVGIWLAARRLGWVAIGWTVLAILGSRIVSGQHSPLDIVAGAGIGIAVLAVCQILLPKVFGRLLNGVVHWTTQHATLASILVFAALFEAANTLQNLRELLKTGANIAKQLIGG
ncbi:MAG TPA: phosphatase PAP2 family protein [Blastocatellia bacterium]|nr:phosphatase PAP2 family protein [Blastocatellia bacterium]